MTEESGADRMYALLLGELRTAHHDRTAAGVLSAEEASADLRARLDLTQAMCAQVDDDGAGGRGRGPAPGEA